ncbi:hypothetical protein [Roseomonas chloroacetimidivorans]|uniref:aromatic-ring hydroxylase C-terminal domain-containing protein n=1 Tax=Roseomonas chloroacetimidivorans TaxID=1766656 RepID=UPI003C74F065
MICADPEQAPPNAPRRYVPSTVPGVRLPSILLEEGTPIFDRLGPWFTLLSIGMPPERAIIDAAARRGMPLAVLTIGEANAMRVYGRHQMLVRPDQHIAWRGMAADAVLADRVIARVLGQEVGVASPSPVLSG